MSTINEYKAAYDKAKASNDTAGMKAAHDGAEAIRAKEGYSGGADGSQRISLKSKVDVRHISNMNKPVQVSTSSGVRTLNSIEDAETDAERSIFFGAQDKIAADKNQYAYVDEYGFEHVGSMSDALTYGRNGNFQRYDGPASRGYARDANGNRAMMGLEGSRDYGNAPKDDAGNILRYQAAGTLDDRRYNINSALDEYYPVVQALTNPVVVPPGEAPVIKPVYSGPSHRPKVDNDSHGNVKLDRNSESLRINPTNTPALYPDTTPAQIRGGHDPDAEDAFEKFTKEGLIVIARGTGTAALMAQQKLKQMGIAW